MLGAAMDKVVRPVARYLEKDFDTPMGIGKTMSVAHAYNRWRYGQHEAFRRDQYRNHFDELIEENGRPDYQPPEMADGWCIDTSRQLPHLDQLLADAEEIMRERALVRRKLPGNYIGSNLPFIQHMTADEDLVKYPSILRFATSSAVLSVVSKYFGLIPSISVNTPPGVRLMESWVGFDEKYDGKAYGSQLFHIDFYASPMIYVVVPLREITEEMGPFCFLPASTSTKAAAQLRYRARGVGYRVNDEDLYAVVDRSEVHSLCSQPGEKILFIDSSACFHFGSRDAVKPRYMMMFAYVGPCRTDFCETVRPGREWLRPPQPGDSRLVKMVLNRSYLGEQVRV